MRFPKIIVVVGFVIALMPVFSVYSTTEKNGMDTQYYDNGNIKTYGYYEENHKTGPWISFNESGSMDKIVFYNDSGDVEKIMYNYESNYQLFLSAFLAVTVVLTVLLIREKKKNTDLKVVSKNLKIKN